MATQDENDNAIADALTKDGVSVVLNELVQKELQEQIVATRKARDDAGWYSRAEGLLSGVLVTVGIALGAAAAMELLPLVMLSAAGAGVAGTFGVLLGIAAVQRSNDAVALDSKLQGLEAAARVDAKDRSVAIDLVREELCQSLSDEKKAGKGWLNRVAATETPTHSLGA